CKYHVKWPNALWHMDGHHKLIQWGIVIHGFIDGFCCCHTPKVFGEVDMDVADEWR
ncbi:hypothetical protein F5J12DRAFT_721182, partial [Pisolithus orientalis]|uniref:uncharacterized protein n=1 Tax=Pisolithus orientalis TaxID=936130 RepID=UPI0022250EC8